LEASGKKEKRYGAPFFAALVGLGLAFFYFVFHHFRVSFADYGKFLLAFFAVVWAPGYCLFWLTKLKVLRVERLTLSLALGLSSSTLIYKFARLLQADWLFWVWVGAALVASVLHLILRPLRKHDFTFRLTGTGLAFLGLCFLIFLVLFMDNYRNGIRQPDGSLLVNLHYYDGFIRNAVIRELSHSVPPQMPFAAGFPLGYHYGMDLVISLFYREFHLDVLDLIHRFLLTFFFALTFLSLFVFLNRFFHSQKKALYGAGVLLFGCGGLTYAAGFLVGAPQAGHVFLNFYLFDILSVNSFLPGLGLLLAGFFALMKYLENHSLSWLLSAGFLLASCGEFKAFFLVPIVGALAVSGAFYSLRFRKFSLLRVLVLTLLFSLPLLCTAYLSAGAGFRYRYVLRFTDWIIRSLQGLKIPAFQTAWQGLFYQGHFNVANIALSLLAALVFLLGTFGLSVLSLPALVRCLLSPRRDEAMRFFLATFFWTSIGAFFCFTIMLINLPRNILNSYIYYLGLIVLGMFFLEALFKFSDRRTRPVRVLLLLAVMLLTFPNSVRFLWVKTRSPQPVFFSSSFVEAAAWTSKKTPPEAVILQPLGLRCVCYLADRRVVLDHSAHSYLDFHLPETEIKKRVEDVRRFFSSPALSGDVLSNYSVSLIWTSNNQGLAKGQKGSDTSLICFTSLGTEKIRKYQMTHRLSLAYQNAEYSLYSVEELPEKDKGIYLLEKTESGPSWKKFE